MILASSDQVAIDAVAATIMGFDWKKIPCLALSHENKLGIADPADIEIVGDADAAKENYHFDVGVNFATGVGRLLWYDTPLRFFQKLFFHTPLVHIFILASELYHDKVWYTLKGKPLVRKWENESEWGQLFKSYAK